MRYINRLFTYLLTYFVILYGMRVPVAVWQVRLRTAISVYNDSAFALDPSAILAPALSALRSATADAIAAMASQQHCST